MQVLNLLHKSLSTSGSIIRRPIPMRIVDQPVDKSESNAEQTQDQSVTPVSFASATQVRMDIAVLSLVGQGVPQVPPVWVTPFANHKCSKHSKHSSVHRLPNSQGHWLQLSLNNKLSSCRKCGKKYHPTSHCHQKVTCRKCKGKDHSAKFCSTPNQEELKCTFCGKNKHSVENCKTRKKAEKKIQKELKGKRTSMVTSTTTSTTSSRTPSLSQAQPSQTHQQAPVTHKTMQQVPLQVAGIEERLQCLANGVDQSTSLGLLPPSPAPPAYTSA